MLNDRFTAKMKKIAGTSANSINKVNRTLKHTKKLTHNLDQLENKLHKLKAAQKGAFSIKQIRSYNAEIRRTEKGISRLNRKGRIAGSGGKTSMLGGMGGAMLGMGAVYGALRLGSDIVKTTAKYERYRAVLKNTYQDQTKANMAMADLTRFASKTPFQIDELTDSFIKLTNAGMEPSMKDMTSLGDLAASQGKQFGQLSEAILDAQMGEFERLKEFGIKGLTKGDKYQFRFKGNTVEIEKSEKAVKNYILSLGKLKGVQGGMNAISETTGGKISNLADNWDQLKATIGSANTGVIKDAIGGFSSLVAGANDYMKVPLSQKMSQEKTGVNSLVKSITSYNVTGEQRQMLLTQLQEQYPDFLGNLDAETASNEKLLERLDKVNASYEKKIKLQTSSEKLGFNQQLIDEANLKKGRATQILNLMRDAETGDEGALRMFKSMQSNKEFIKSSFTLNNIFRNKRWENLKKIYKTQTEEADEDSKKLNVYKRKYTAEEQSDKVSIFLSELSSRKGKLSESDLVSLETLQEDLSIYQSNLSKGQVKRAGRGASLDLIEKTSSLMADIDALFVEPGNKTKLTSTNFSGSGGSGIPGSGIDQIAGEKSIAKNLIINIDKLVEGGINIKSETLKEGMGEAQEIVLQGLLSAVNDVNGA